MITCFGCFRLQKEEDLDICSVDNVSLTQENKKLKDQLNEAAREARLVRSLKDELDIFKERAAKADRMEAELELAKHKLEELDYFRQRLEVPLFPLSPLIHKNHCG